MALALAAMLVTLPRPGEAYYNYPWCAQYSDGSGIFSCAFANYPQCLATVSGVGGFCMTNPALTFSPLMVQLGAPLTVPRRAKRHRHLSHR
jgi:hypothetical protein